MLRLAAFALALLLAAAPAPSIYAQTSDDDALTGFDDEETPKSNAPEARAEEISPFTWGGSIAEEISANYAHHAPEPGDSDHRGLSSLRTRLDLDADLKLSGGWRSRASAHAFYDAAYAVNDRSDYSEGFLDAYESEAEIDEAFIEGPLFANFDIKLGRQIVVWGQADNIRVTDVLNPLNLRQPGRTDVEELRLPLIMSKLSYHAGSWSLSAVAVHEARYNKSAVPGSDFFPPNVTLPPERRPSQSLDNTEFGLALDGRFPGWDLSFYAANTFNDSAHVGRDGEGLVRKHARLGMLGAAGAVALGNWLLKGEAALLDGFKFSGAPGETFSRIDTLAGVEFSGLSDTTVSLEVVNRHLLGFDGRTAGAPEDARRNDFQSALRITQSYLNETLDLTFIAATHGPDGENGAVQRLQASYDISDSLIVTGGLINYLGGDKLSFSGVGRNDRLFLELVYHF